MREREALLRLIEVFDATVVQWPKRQSSFVKYTNVQRNVHVGVDMSMPRSTSSTAHETYEQLGMEI